MTDEASAADEAAADQGAAEAAVGAAGEGAGAAGGAAESGDQGAGEPKGSDAPETNGVDAQAQVEHWKAQARKHETRASENYAKAQRVDAAEARVAELERELLISRIAAEKGVPAELLTGADEAAITAQADAALAFRGTRTNVAGVLDGGEDPAPQTEQLGRDDLRGLSPGEVMQALREGRLKQVLGK